jgi:Carboxypeptidase regulatory-like domain
VVDVARGASRALNTDGAGEYVANALIPGTYTVRAVADGFRTVERSGVVLEVGQNIRVDLVLQPGEQTQTVTVTEEIPFINAADPQLGGTVGNEAINQLPLNGRNFQRLLQLHPGVVTTPGSGTGNGDLQMARNKVTTCSASKASPPSPKRLTYRAS